MVKINAQTSLHSYLMTSPKMKDLCFLSSFVFLVLNNRHTAQLLKSVPDAARTGTKLF